MPSKKSIDVVYKVKVIRQEGQAALVEVVTPDGILRKVLPIAALSQDGLVDPQAWAQGIPYGLPWEDLIQFKATPAQFANNLHVHGIWTLEDLQSNPNEAFAAWQDTYRLDIAGLIRLAKLETTKNS
jgi:hypothetical protein